MGGFLSGAGAIWLARAAKGARERQAVGLPAAKVSGLGLAGAFAAVLGAINLAGGIALGRPVQAGVGAVLLIAGIRLGRVSQRPPESSRLDVEGNPWGR